MKKLFAGFALLGTIAFASAQTITFDQTTLDYGTVKPGSDGNRVFTVKNTGDKPLIISAVQPSCGCTTPEWSKDAILPGKTGVIKVHYDTNRQGQFLKMIQVMSNDPENSRSVINIKGNVDPNAAEAAVVAPAPVKASVEQKPVVKKKAVKQTKKVHKTALK